MRYTLAVALCLALCGLAQALDGGVLLEGYTPIKESSASAGGASVLHHHWRARHPPPHPDDHPYWDARRAAKDEFFRCLEWAVRSFDKGDSTTWKPASQNVAHCVLTHLAHCHDFPNLPNEFRTFVPWVLFVNGMDALVAQGDTGLLHTELVLDWYLVGGVPQTPDGQPNIWYIQGGCASTIVTLLSSATTGGKLTVQSIHALAKAFVAALDNPNSQLSKCSPDIPAILLGVTSTYCPEEGFLVAPDGTDVKCTPELVHYEDRAGALLGGSIISFMLLSGNDRIQALSVELALAMNRMAIAATQTTGFVPCYSGNQLISALAQVPRNSGLLFGLVGPQVKTNTPLSADGQRVLCAAINMMSEATVSKTWLSSLFWQGQADIVNAISKTINDGLAPGSQQPVVITPYQKTGLCLVTKAVYTFTNSDALILKGQDLYTTIDAAVNGQVDLKCYTGDGNGLASQCGTLLANTPGVWPFGNPRPTLDPAHSLAIGTSPSGILCKDVWRPSA